MPPKTTAGPTPDSPSIALARLGAVTGRNDEVSEWVDVQFNPASLQLQVSNELKDTKNNERKQYIAKSNAKLTMELQFDTTDTGDDVTQTTRKLQAFIAPPLAPGEEARREVPPPVVMFEWGRLRFKGIAESYRETLDYFSANGVPLRGLVNLTLSQQDKVFDDAPSDAPQTAGSVNDNLAVDTPAASAADIANAAQSPAAARGIAAANGLDTLRFGAGAALTVSASVTLKPPSPFAAGGSAGTGIGGGIGIGAGVAIAGGVGLSASGGVNAAASVGVSGLSRLSASEGAFAGLRATTSGVSTARVNTARLLPAPRAASLSTDRNATFQVGGKATIQGSAGMRADVGGSIRGRGALTFEGS
jgi:hypothetical protein